MPSSLEWFKSRDPHQVSARGRFDSVSNEPRPAPSALAARRRPGRTEEAAVPGRGSLAA